MEKRTKELYEAALKLPESERGTLVDLLLPTLEWDKEAEEVWVHEIERRWGQLKRGEAQGIPWEEQRARRSLDA